MAESFFQAANTLALLAWIGLPLFPGRKVCDLIRDRYRHRPGPAPSRRNTFPMPPVFTACRPVPGSRIKRNAVAFACPIDTCV
jgi:hypothetical protein